MKIRPPRRQTRRFQQEPMRGDTPTAEGHRMTAAELVAKVMAGEHGDFVREAVALIAHELMEAEISAEVGAELHEVSPEQITHRNGYHDRRLPAGDAGVRAARDRRARRLAAENLAAA